VVDEMARWKNLISGTQLLLHPAERGFSR